MALSRQSKILIAAGALALLLLLSPIQSDAEELIKQFEGLRLKSYMDKGSYAIGYGTHYNYDAGRAVRSTDVITPSTALKWLQIENTENGRQLDQAVTVRLNKNERDSLLSLMYNIGDNGFLTSTLVEKLNQGRPRAEVADQFDRWIYSRNSLGIKVRNPDLVKRRALEKQLFLS